MATPPLITLSGPPAAGTSTCSELLSMAFGYEVLNGGDSFRALAAERNLSVAEFTAVAESDPDIDRELDRRLEAAIDAHLAGERDPTGEGLLVESRLAGWHADGRATLSVWLDAPLEVRADRLGDRDEAPAELREREQSDAERYREYYDIDITDLSPYDLVIDTETLSADATFQVVKTAIDDVSGVEHTFREL
ncbi:AAA family ATPase [Natronolimnobius sp. AArcel1]|uniref:(d)CMP kinase n=1 Tax=Natronolimnobius sp. AArcel1 TaxID=1679093 RepID=UPI0013EE1F70|nr:AAA family ATPase [Natronolimnobius sp. AArcel1]NGM68508.1 AAA family ATPase [Natronolimnobius sp. AArcel1]